MNNDTQTLIAKSRKKTITGKLIDLVPFSSSDAANVAAMRNRDRNTYFFNQSIQLTEEDQLAWYEKYLTRDDDIYWCIYTKDHDFIGTVRLYNVDADSDSCEHGSFMVDEEKAEGAPYAIEALLLSIDFAFDTLQVHKMINQDRVDNKVMNNLSKRLGFKQQKTTIINGAEYNYYLLLMEDYKSKRSAFAQIIDYWMERKEN